jgi:hypothetical protein
MKESIILNNPIIIIGFLAALLLCGFALIKKTHFCVMVLSIFIFVATVTYSLLKGAQLYEVGAVATVFFIINLLLQQKNGGK